MKRMAMVIMLLLIGGSAQAYEEPAYEVLAQNEGYEIRRYSSYVVAETTVVSDFEGAGNQAFRRLFGYISGNHRGVETGQGEKIAMTIPVVSTAPAEAVEDQASYTYYFVMPAEYTLDGLPDPADPRITIREAPGQTVAVRRYSGRSNESNFRKNRDALYRELDRDGVPLAGQPVFAVYNGPFTPWFLRRNEVMVEISPR